MLIMKALRVVVILANTAILLFLVFIVLPDIADQADRRGEISVKELLFFGSLLLIHTLSLIYAVCHDRYDAKENWIGLEIEARKAALRKKIRHLNSHA